MGAAVDAAVAEELRQGLLAGHPLPAAMSLYSTQASLREIRVRAGTAAAPSVVPVYCTSAHMAPDKRALSCMGLYVCYIIRHHTGDRGRCA